MKTYQVLVPFCDGEDIYDVLMEYPRVKFTGRKGKRAGKNLVEVEFEDYEPSLFKIKKNKSITFVDEDNITYIS